MRLEYPINHLKGMTLKEDYLRYAIDSLNKARLLTDTPKGADNQARRLKELSKIKEAIRELFVVWN